MTKPPLPNAVGGEGLYFAVRPQLGAASTAAALSSRLAAAHGHMGARTPADRLHISLLGLSRRADVAYLTARMSAMETLPFDVTLDHAIGFRGGPPFPFVLLCSEGEAELQDLRRRIGHTLGGRVARVFTPHMTLFRSQRLIEEHPLAQPVRWRIDELLLVQRGVREPLARWPIGGRLH